MRNFGTFTRTIGALVVLVGIGGVSLAEAGEAQQARVTIFARPTVIAWAGWSELFGAARGAGPDDVVTIEAKECGSPSFRTFAEAHVGAGGGWSMDAGTGVTTTYRAVWRSATSAQVTVRQGASVLLAPRRAGDGLVVSVISKRSLWRKKVEIQRRQGGSWRTVRNLTLTDSGRSTGAVSVSARTFRLAVPGGTQLRAVLPARQAAPCYVRSVSRTVRA